MCELVRRAEEEVGLLEADEDEDEDAEERVALAHGLPPNCFVCSSTSFR